MAYKRQNTGEVYGAPRGSDPIYYSTTILCSDEDDTGSHGQIATFDESRTTPLLPSPNLYEIAVESASIDTKALPTFIADPISSDPNKLKPLVGLELTWTASLFPQDSVNNSNSSYSGGGLSQTTEIGISTLGSSLPVKYNRPGTLNTMAPLYIQSLSWSSGNPGLWTFTVLTPNSIYNATNWISRAVNPKTFVLNGFPKIQSTVAGQVIDINGLVKTITGTPTIVSGNFNPSTTGSTAVSTITFTTGGTAPLNWPTSGSLTFIPNNYNYVAYNSTTPLMTTPDFVPTLIPTLPNNYDPDSIGSQYYGLSGSVTGYVDLFRANNPNSCEWNGNYVINPSTSFFLSSVNRALERAFGLFLPFEYSSVIGPIPLSTIPDTMLAPKIYTVTSCTLSTDGYWYVSVPNVTFPSIANKQWIGQQILVSSANTLLCGYFILANNGQTSASTSWRLTATVSDLLTKNIISPSSLLSQCTLAICCTQDLVGVPGFSLQTLPQVPYAQLVATQQSTPVDTALGSTFIKIQGFSFSFSTNAGAGNYVYAKQPPMFDFLINDLAGSNFFNTPSNGTLGSFPLEFKGSVQSPYCSYPPSRNDFIKTIYLLGFLPNTTMNLLVPQGGQQRCLAPPFLSSLSLASYRNLSWSTQDEYETNPVRGGPYYYNYGFSYFLNNVVNKSLVNCVLEDLDKAFSSSNLPPFQVIQSLNSSGATIQHITDLSLSAQLYILTYYNTNSSQATQDTPLAIKPWVSGTSYIIGSGVLYTDPTFPGQTAVWICNTEQTSLIQTKPSLLTESWLYAGPFLPSTYVSNYTYMASELVSYNGTVYSAIQKTSIVPGTDSAIWAPVFFLCPPAYPNNQSTPYNYLTQLMPPPIVGTSAPVFTLDKTPGDCGNIFSVRLDTYGFGTFDFKQPKSSINALGRDSWGQFGISSTFASQRVFDEYMFFQSNTAFKDLFNGFPVKCVKYTDPFSGVQSAYWDYLFILDPTQSVLGPNGINTNGFVSRNSDNTFYYYVFSSSQTSIYSCWNPVQSIVIELTNVPVDDQPVSDACVITNTDQTNVITSGKTRRIVAEFYPDRNPSEGTVLYRPQIHRNMYMISGSSLKSFSYSISWRNRLTNELVPLKLSSGGSANVVFKFNPKP